MRIELTEDRVRIGVRAEGGAEREVLYDDIDKLELGPGRGGKLVIVRRDGVRDVITGHEAAAVAAEIGAIVDGYATLIRELETPADLARMVDELDARPGFLATGFVQFLLWATVHLGASELHVAPSRLGAVIRLRVDGAMHIGGAVSAARGRRIAARLKVLAGLKPHRTDVPQAGRASVVCGDALETFRMAFLPVGGGERVEVRVFDRRKAGLLPDELGFDDRALARLRRAARARQGVVLLASPAAHGKTTTTYALVRELAAERGEGLSIASVEDAIECDLAGVDQCESRPLRDGLYAALRRPVDVVVVDELCSRETAQVAFEAAGKGRLVIATLRADTAADAVVQLMDYGVPPPSLAASLRAVSCQRVLRGARADKVSVGEVLVADDVVRDVIERAGPATAIEATARAAGMVPLRTVMARMATSHG